MTAYAGDKAANKTVSPASRVPQGQEKPCPGALQVLGVHSGAEAGRTHIPGLGPDLCSKRQCLHSTAVLRDEGTKATKEIIGPFKEISV